MTSDYCIDRLLERKYREMGSENAKNLKDVALEITRNCINVYSEKFGEGDDDPKSGGLSLMRAYRGLPKHNALIKFLSEPGVRVKLQKSENYYLADQQKEMPKVDEELYFHIDETIR